MFNMLVSILTLSILLHLEDPVSTAGVRVLDNGCS